jgi:hypothetical protein
MSQSQTHPDSLYGIREFDLSDPRDDELLQLPSATYLATLDAPAEAYLRLGSETARRIDLRSLDSIKLDSPIGQAYLSNPGNTGTLRLLAGKAGNIEITPEQTIDAIEDITGTVTTNPTDRAAREIGKIRAQDSGGVLIDPATEPTLSAIAGALGSNENDQLLVQEDTPLDVSAATVPTDPSDGDAGSISAAALVAGGTVTVASLSAIGAESLHGQVQSSGSYDVSIDWTDGTGTVIRSETVATGVAGGSWTEINADAKGPNADVIISDASGADQTADGTAHMG